MTDKKLTDSEIIKALECCMDEMGCKKGCPCFDPKSKNSHCTAVGDNGLEKLALDLINRIQAENERLKKANEMFTDIGKLYSEIKAEAYKEFAERLKMRAINRYNEFEDYQEYPYATITHIDELLKELVGEDDA